MTRLRRLLARLFRERQIYHRSDGVVHFIQMSSKTQIAMAALVLGFLSWVAYSSVNVVFKEQIILAKDRKYRLMENTLQTRIASGQRAYDEVNILNDIIRDEFTASMRELNGRHQALEAVVQEKSVLDEQLDSLAEALASTGAPGGRALKNGNRVMVDSVGREPTQRQSRTPRLRQSSLAVRLKEAALNLGAFQKDGAGEMRTDEYIRVSVDEMRHKQSELLVRIEEDIQEKVVELYAILDATGIEPAVMIAQTESLRAANTAQGGPFIELADAAQLVFDGQNFDKIQNEGFFKHTYRIASHLDRLQEVETALKSIPLAMPLQTRYRISSEFGRRQDPFTNKPAYHPGTDFGADWKSPVLAAAPGRISFVGVRSGYGKTVEIDHGNGFKTRYAHLHRITVKRGEQVELQDQIGQVGSTGRATGPHLHYEVWFNGKLRNPRRFLEAGRYVFES